MKPLGVVLLTSNIIGFGNQTVVFADTDNVLPKGQTEKQELLKEFKKTTVSSVAIDSVEELSDLQRIMVEVIKEDNGISNMFYEHTKAKAEKQGIEFDYLEFLKAMLDEGIKISAKVTEVPFLSFFVPLIDTFFPKKEEDVWEEIKPKVEMLINEKLDERFTKETLDTLVSKLQGLSQNMNTLKEYIKVFNDQAEEIKTNDTNAIAAYEQNPKEKQAERIRTSLDVVLGNINSMSDEFRRREYAIPSLPLYTQLANIHIGILKEMVEHGEEWGIDKENVKQYKVDLRKAIKTYSDQVYKTYNEGLDKIKKIGEQEGENEGETEQYGSHVGATIWKRVNPYVRTMTLTCLDFLPLWSAQDVVKYQNPTHLQRTRSIYDDGIMQMYNNGGYDGLRNKFHAGYPGELKEVQYSQGEAVYGMKMTYDWGGGNDGSTWSTSAGTLKNPYTRTAPFRYGAWKYSPARNTIEVGGKEAWSGRPAYPGHKLSRIIITGINTNDHAVQGLVNAYIPVETQLVNKVGNTRNVKVQKKDENGKLMQDNKGKFILEDKTLSIIEGIPAEKYKEHKGFSSALEEINGANVMVSDKSRDWLTYNVTSETTQQYKIRYRVATKGKTSFELSIKDTRTDNYNKIANINIPDTTIYTGNQDQQNGITGKQGTYIVVDGPTLNLQKGQNTISIVKNNGNWLALDRIEFVPLGEDTKQQGESGWQQKDGKWYYIDESKEKVKGWKEINGKYYYFGKTGDGVGLSTEGEMAIGWKKINGKQYYFARTGDESGMSSEGEMAKGWYTLDGKTYHFTENGDMQIGWEKIDGKYYYFTENGDMQTGWIQTEGKYYHLTENGDMQTGWQETDDGAGGKGRYYFGVKGDETGLAEGEMALGITKINGVYYYLEEYSNVGKMATGWREMHGGKYYFNEVGSGTGMNYEGEMAMGHKTVWGKKYYFQRENISNRGQLQYSE